MIVVLYTSHTCVYLQCLTIAIILIRSTQGREREMEEAVVAKRSTCVADVAS